MADDHGIFPKDIFKLTVDLFNKSDGITKNYNSWNLEPVWNVWKNKKNMTSFYPIDEVINWKTYGNKSE